MGGGERAKVKGQELVTTPPPCSNQWPNTNRAGKLPSGLQPVGLLPISINSTTKI